MNSSDFLESRLRAIVPRLVPGASDVADLRAIPGGASQEIWTFDAVTCEGNVPLILRRAPPGSRQHASAVGLENEARLLELVGAAGVPVPGVRGVLSRDDGLGEGFVMDRIAGETNSRRILRDAGFAGARARLARQCGESLARIHAIPRGQLPPMRAALASEEVAHYRGEHARAGTPRPVFELAFQWLQRRLPQQPVQTALVHGDFRNGNLVVCADGLRAVLDWELAHLGDPMEDLGWISVNSWRYGRSELPVGGFGVREDLFAGYEAGGGRVDPDRVRFWEVLGTLKWGVMCEGMALSYQSGDVRTVERAAIGRRTSETEIDLLLLMQPESR